MTEPNRYYRFTYLSKIYYDNGLLLSDLCKNIEIESNPTDEKIRLHRAYYFGSFFNLISSLESFINEIFGNLSGDIQTPTWVYLFDGYVDLIKNAWLNGNIRTQYTILGKYDKLLELSNRPIFNKGSHPYQDMCLIIKLRNELIHYKPDWTMTVNGANQKTLSIEKRLSSKRIKLNPFAKDDDDFFPIKIVSSGYLDWIIKTMIDFNIEFNKKINGG